MCGPCKHKLRACIRAVDKPIPIPLLRLIQAHVWGSIVICEVVLVHKAMPLLAAITAQERDPLYDWRGWAIIAAAAIGFFVLAVAHHETVSVWLKRDWPHWRSLIVRCPNRFDQWLLQDQCLYCKQFERRKYFVTCPYCERII